jgi:hypothetical protein
VILFILLKSVISTSRLAIADLPRDAQAKETIPVAFASKVARILHMKKLLCSSVFVAFALAVQAGDTKVSKDTKAAGESPCCSAKTTQTSTAAKTTPVSASTDKGKMGCCSADTACKASVAKKASPAAVLMSPKTAAMMASR